MNFRFWRKREKFLLLEVRPDRTTALFLSMDRESRLRIDREKEHIGPKEMQAFLKVHRAKSNIIIAADPSLVVTSFLPLHIERAAKDTPLSPTELENLLSKGIAQVFNQCRADAAQELGVDDLDTILVNSQVVHFKIDGHQVLNPVGFPAKTVQAVAELTLTTRPVFERLHELLASHRTFFFTEPGRAGLLSIAKVRGMPVRLVTLGAEQSSYFVMQKAAVGYHMTRARLVWHTVRFREAIADAFGVTHQIAQDLYALYLTGGLSASAMRYFDRLVKPSLQALAAELKLAHLKGETYCAVDMVLPVALPHRSGGVTLTEPPLADIMQALGISFVPDEWGKTTAERFMRVAPFLEFYFKKNTSEINEWLKRHMNWLGASV